MDVLFSIDADISRSFSVPVRAPPDCRIMNDFAGADLSFCRTIPYRTEKTCSARMRVIFEVSSVTRATDRFEETQLTAAGR